MPVTMVARFKAQVAGSIPLYAHCLRSSLLLHWKYAMVYSDSRSPVTWENHVRWGGRW